MPDPLPLGPTTLRCVECGTEVLDGADVEAWCDRCFGRRAVVHAWDVIAARVERDDVASGPPSLWRYAPLLAATPFGDSRPGWTPLRPAEALGDTLGLDDLWIKDETANPSSSFKDRVVATALARARATGASAVACASTGNLARALAVAAPAWGLRAVVVVPASLDADRLTALTGLGATVLVVEGPYDVANRLAAEAAMDPVLSPDCAWVNVTLRPWYVEGGATVGYEICEQLGWRAPRHVVAPAASGALLVQTMTAIEALGALGWIEQTADTAVSVAQPAGCAPIVRAFDAGIARVEPVRGQTVASSLAMGDPPEGDEVIARCRASGGGAIAVAEDAIDRWQHLVAELEGIVVEPAGGVVIGAVAELRARELIAASDRVVAVVTGGVAPPADPGPAAVSIEPTLTALRAALDSTA